MRHALILALCLAAAPVAAEEAPDPQSGPNRTAAAGGPPGPVARYIAAARLLPLGFAAEDPASVLAAVRLARSVTRRPASGWSADPAPLPAPAPEAALPRDPGGEEAALLLDMMTEGDEDWQLTVAEQMARRPGPGGGASVLTAGIAAGGSQSWTIPFYGEAPAEIGLVALTGEGLALRVADGSGAEICSLAAAEPAALCAFTPARNGWFTVELTNGGGAAAGYLLLTN